MLLRNYVRVFLLTNRILEGGTPFRHVPRGGVEGGHVALAVALSDPNVIFLLVAA